MLRPGSTDGCSPWLEVSIRWDDCDARLTSNVGLSNLVFIGFAMKRRVDGVLRQPLSTPAIDEPTITCLGGQGGGSQLGTRHPDGG